MDSDEGKLFIGGISWDTTEDKLNEYFGKYGEVLQSVIMRDKTTGRPRGFGFVGFADPSVLDSVLQDQHTIDGRIVEAKRALSREEQHTNPRSGNPNGRTFGGGGGSIKTKKIFVGGLPPTLTEEGFRQYFEAYGNVTDVVIMYDQSTQRPRGFGFISFDTEEAVDRVLHKTFHDLNGKSVEVKRALPKELNSGGGGGRSSSGGSYQGYGASGANTGAYDGRMDNNRYMQPQATGGGFPAYGSSGYGGPGPGYGYGAANNAVGYGGFGGYPSSNAAYGGPVASGPAGAARSPWASQLPSAAYGVNTGYGTATPWSASGVGGTVSAQTGQSPSGGAGYGNQGYGYGGSDGSYANPSGGYGAAGGRAGGTPNSNAAGAGGGDLQGTGGGYMGGGYSDSNSGYPNAVWRSDPSQAGNYSAGQVNVPQGGQVGYGGGYGGSHSRQAQQ